MTILHEIPELGLPYARVHVIDGRLYRTCPVCARWISEDTDANGEITSDRYGEHYRTAATIEDAQADFTTRLDTLIGGRDFPASRVLVAAFHETGWTGVRQAANDMVDAALRLGPDWREKALIGLSIAFWAYMHEHPEVTL